MSGASSFLLRLKSLRLEEPKVHRLCSDRDWNFYHRAADRAAIDLPAAAELAGGQQRPAVGEPDVIQIVHELEGGARSRVRRRDVLAGEVGRGGVIQLV